MALEALLDDGQVTLLKAGSGEEALQLLLDHEVALVLLDIAMPGMDGYEVAELMRSSRRTQHRSCSSPPSCAMKTQRCAAIAAAPSIIC